MEVHHLLRGGGFVGGAVFQARRPLRPKEGLALRAWPDRALRNDNGDHRFASKLNFIVPHCFFDGMTFLIALLISAIPLGKWDHSQPTRLVAGASRSGA